MNPEVRLKQLAPDEILGPHPDRVGGLLHDALHGGLTTRTDNGAALALYRGRGWRVVVPELFFPSHPNRPFCVMGRDPVDGL